MLYSLYFSIPFTPHPRSHFHIGRFLLGALDESWADCVCYFSLVKVCCCPTTFFLYISHVSRHFFHPYSLIILRSHFTNFHQQAQAHTHTLAHTSQAANLHFFLYVKLMLSYQFWIHEFGCVCMLFVVRKYLDGWFICIACKLPCETHYIRINLESVREYTRCDLFVRYLN